MFAGIHGDKRHGMELDLRPPNTQNTTPEEDGNFDRHAVTPQQVKRLIASLPEPAKSIAPLSVLTGLRIGELLAVRWKNVNLNDKVLQVMETVIERDFRKPKTRRSVRAIPLCREEVSNLSASRQDVREPLENPFGPKLLPM